MKLLKSNNVFLLAIMLSYLIVNILCLEPTLIEVDSNSVQGNQVIGKMEVNGVKYSTICDCKPTSPIKPNLGNNKCDPSKLRIHNERAGKGASFDDIRALVSNIEELPYVVVPETSFRCLDGRHISSYLFTPGGDTGEFLLSLMVYEDLLGGNRKLTQENVDAFFMDYLKFMKHATFHMCTDDEAVNHLQKELAVTFN